MPGAEKIAPAAYEALDPRVETLVNELIGRVADKWTMLLLEALEEGEFAGGEEFVDLLGDGLADAGNVGEFTAGGDDRGFLAQGAQGFGGALVGADFEDQFVVDFHQVGDAVEDVGKLLVVHGTSGSDE